MPVVETGLDRLVSRELTCPVSGRIALLCNANTVDRRFIPSAEAIAALPEVTLHRIFSPQHGFCSEKQDNMIESDHASHPTLGIAIHSLYSDHRLPDDIDFADIDAIVIDLQDIGTRVYTFMSTALLTLAEAINRDLPVVILDRPNPISGAICAGPVLEPPWRSFVGMLDIPLRHGLSLGEICLYSAVQQHGFAPPSSVQVNTDPVRLPYPGGSGALTVIPAKGWSRDAWFDETGLPWTMPSPNMPTLDTAVCYPGQVALEGTLLSEGRGTTRPFELFGAPYIKPAAILAVLRDIGYAAFPAAPIAIGECETPLAGLLLRAVSFEPTFQKHAGRLCHGFQLHVVDRRRYCPVAATVAMLWAIAATHGDDFSWRQPPYEYEETLMPIDMIFGTDRVRRDLDAGKKPIEIIQTWEDGLAAFKTRCNPCYIYGD